MGHRTWGGRFAEGPSELAARFNASLPFDRALWREDLWQNRVHARMLHRVGLLSQEELEAIGFSINIVNYDPGQWFGKLFPGDFQMSMFFGLDADTPFNYYRNIMSSQTFKPVGTPTGFGQNFWRVVVPEAEPLLEKFSSTDDSAVQHQVAIELQKVFAQNAPVIPLFTAGTFYVYSEAKVSGWANEENRLTRAMPIGQNATSEQLIQMVSWKPKE